jgi:hypothetical protein
MVITAGPNRQKIRGNEHCIPACQDEAPFSDASGASSPMEPRQAMPARLPGGKHILSKTQAISRKTECGKPPALAYCSDIVWTGPNTGDSNKAALSRFLEMKCEFADISRFFGARSRGLPSRERWTDIDERTTFA